MQDLPDVERGGHRLVQAGERARAFGVFAGLLKQAVLFDRQRGLVGEAREQRDLVRAKASPLLRVHVQYADYAAVRPERHTEKAVESQIDGGPLVAWIVARVLSPIRDDDGLARRDHGATQTLAHGDPRAGHDGGGRFGAGSDDQVVAVAQPKPRAFDLEQRRRRIHDEIENLPALLDGREPAGDVVENLEAAALAILCAVRMRRRRAFGHLDEVGRQSSCKPSAARAHQRIR